eukprot:2060025-Pyramimonas_sp.AAC.1
MPLFDRSRYLYKQMHKPYGFRQSARGAQPVSRPVATFSGRDAVHLKFAVRRSTSLRKIR